MDGMTDPIAVALRLLVVMLAFLVGIAYARKRTGR